MNFLSKNQPLDFGTSNVEGFQYYQWKYKQKLIQEEEERKQLDKWHQKIINEENQQKIKKPSTQHYIGSFYDYNLEWKKKVEEKVHQEKQLKQKYKENCQKLSMETKNTKNTNQYLFETEHQGPIKGWHQNFNNYMKTKKQLIEKEETLTFEPKINEKSRLLTRNMTEKVQDRLLRFGESLKHRIKEKSIMERMNQQSQQEPMDNQDLFIKLYKDGEIANRRRANVQNEYSFKPTIRELPKNLEKKVQQRRRPLYEVKTAESNKKQTKIQKKSKGSFQNFIKRNQALFETKLKNRLKFKEEQDEKQQCEQKQCTFSPKLNPNSMKINQNRLSKVQYFEVPDQFKTDRMHKGSISEIRESSVKQNTSYLDSLDESDSISKYQAVSDIKEDEKTTQRKSNIIRSNVLLFQGPVQEEEEEEEPIEITGSSIIKRYQHDSLDRGKDDEWETQLQEIEDKLEVMMLRAQSD